MTPQSGLYVGTLRHRRFGERPHQFTFRIFMPLLDIDRVAEAMRVSRLTGYNRWNWATFDDRDHFGNPSRTLRERLRESARGEGVELSEGPVFLLTHLRYAGYVFNPISIFYCYEPDGRLAHVLAEVNNTYGGRHLYWLTDAGGRATNSFHARVEKSLYVSPFIDVDVNYEFVLTPPGDSLVAHMNVLQTNACGSSDRMLDATLSLTYRPWTATEIRSALMRFPLMTTKVIAAIHWQALRLYLKGVPVVPRLVANGEGERRAQADAHHQPLIVEPAKESR